MEVEESERRQRETGYFTFTVKSSFNARQCIFIIIIIHLMESNAHLIVFQLKGCSDLCKLKSENPKYIN